MGGEAFDLASDNIQWTMKSNPALARQLEPYVTITLLERMPDGIEYVRGSSRFDESRNVRCTAFTNVLGDHFIREVGPDTDVWLRLNPAWYENLPSRIARLFAGIFAGF